MVSLRLFAALLLNIVFVQTVLSSPHPPSHYNPGPKPHTPTPTPLYNPYDTTPTPEPMYPTEEPTPVYTHTATPTPTPSPSHSSSPKPVYTPHTAAPPHKQPHTNTPAPHTTTSKPIPPPEMITCYEAFAKCNFRFKGFSSIPTFNIHVYDNTAFTTQVVSKRQHEILGVLNTNHIVPEFIIGNKALPITQFGSQKFTPTAFKPFPIPYTYGSGVGRETLHGDQLYIAKGKCVRIFFSNFQILSPYNYNVIDNVYNLSRSANNCVVFKTAA